MVAAAQTVSLVLEKLWENLLHEKKIVCPAGFRDKFFKAIKRLKEDAQSNDESMQQLAEFETTWSLPTMYAAEDIISTFLVRTEQQRRKGFIRAAIGSLIWWNQSQSRQDLADMLNKMEDSLHGEPWRMQPRISDTCGGSIINPTEGPTRQELGSTSSDYSGQQLESDRTVGRGEEIQELLDRMIHHGDDQLRVISVVGMEAVGKTALARYIYNRSDIKEHFQCRVWVRDPNTSVHKDLLVDILRQLPISQLSDVEHMNEEKLQETLCKFLMEKRYLVVLDDVLKLDNWYKLVIPFADSRNGSRVILTTRIEGVAEIADPWRSLIQLRPLTDGKSWELFSKKAAAVRRPENSSSGSSNDSNRTDQINDLKGKILRKCHGSPLALVLLGGLLSATELNQQSTVLLELEKFCEETEAQSDAALKDIAAWCYHKLPFWLQPCFLYFINFPKAFEIPTRRLLRLWHAEGFQTWSPDIQEDQDPEDVRVDRYLQELVNRNVIEVERAGLDGSPKTCRMPGFLHETFSPEAEKIGLFHGNRSRSMSSSDPSNSAASSEPPLRRLALLHIDHSDLESNPVSIRHLRSYASFDTQKRGTRSTEFVKIFKPARNLGFKLLKVLDLEGVYKPTLPNEELRELLNLRYLGLRWTSLDSLPACVGDLPFLETLDLKHTNVTTLPSSIWKAKKLRHLYMNEIELSIPKASTTVQTLWGLFIGSNGSLLKDLLIRLPSLKKLGVTCHSTSAEATAEGISKLTKLQSLRLISRDLIGRASDLNLDPLKDHVSLSKLYLLGLLPDGVDELPQNLKMLTLSMSELKDDPMPVIGQLRELKILRLYARSYVETEMTCPSGCFSKLQVLKLWMLEKLEDWTVEEDAMPCLEVLEIRSCKELKKKPDGLERLSTLKELILTNMPQEFVKDIKENRGNDQKYALITKEWEFSPLEE